MPPQCSGGRGNPVPGQGWTHASLNPWQWWGVDNTCLEITTGGRSIPNIPSALMLSLILNPVPSLVREECRGVAEGRTDLGLGNCPRCPPAADEGELVLPCLSPG